MKEFSLNDNVKIKLTETGIKILNDTYDAALKEFEDKPSVLQSIVTSRPKVDENGYVEMQLFEVMAIFGKYVIFGNPNLPISTNIAISENYLKDLDAGRGL